LGVSCLPNPCPPPTGSCCQRTACTVTTAANCTGGTWGGAATSCQALSCCQGDFNQDGGLTLQDLFDFLNAWFAQDPSADFDGFAGVNVSDIFSYIDLFINGCP
jgi:hypothetical protein